MSVFKPDPQCRVYKVAPNSNVTAAVTIGNAQRGGWAMSVLAETFKGTDEDTAPEPLGTGGALSGQFLQVDITVVDIREETDRLSAVVAIDGGLAGRIEIPQEVRDTADGDVAVFTTVVMFQ